MGALPHAPLLKGAGHKAATMHNRPAPKPARRGSFRAPGSAGSAMIESTIPEDAATTAPAQATPDKPSKRPAWVQPATALLVGLIVGGGLGAGAVAAWSDPTHTDEYRTLQQEFEDAQSKIADAQRQATAVGAAAQKAATDAAQRDAELDQRETAVTARETSVTAVEQQIAANSIEEGTWTVGRDVAPGTYRTSQAVSGQCYWSITRTGSNGSDIVENDIVSGGFPTVTLKEGQDFTNSRCGTFVKE